MLKAGEQSTKDQEQRRYERAHARVQAIKGLYVHATAFVVVNVALLALNALVGGVWWFYWPLIGWGLGLGLHAFGVFGSPSGNFYVPEARRIVPHAKQRIAVNAKR